MTYIDSFGAAWEIKKRPASETGAVVRMFLRYYRDRDAAACAAFIRFCAAKIPDTRAERLRVRLGLYPVGRRFLLTRLLGRDYNNIEDAFLRENLGKSRVDFIEEIAVKISEQAKEKKNGY